MDRSTILICTVGTSVSPVIKTIDYHEPTYVIYIVSEDSREKVPEITRGLSWQGIKDTYTITISDYENIASAMKDIRSGLQDFIKLKKLPSDTCFDADITGGTKPMSSALSQVVTELVNCRILYVGGIQRNPAERMIVVDGKEKFIHVGNPWDEMGYSQSRRLTYAFNTCQFQAAEAEALFLKDKRKTYEPFYDSLAMISKAFRLWESFDYRQANILMPQALGKIRFYNNYSFPTFMPLFDKLNNAGQILAALKEDVLYLTDKMKLPLEEDVGRKFLLDLLANARRCARNGRYDDAVARLYSAIEKSAKIALACLGKNNSNLSLKDLREVKDDFEEKYANEINKITDSNNKRGGQGVKLGLGESFRYLRALQPNNALAKEYFENEEDISNALMARNQSLLAHGFVPIASNHYETLFQTTLKLLKIEEKELWDFPQIKLEEILI